MLKTQGVDGLLGNNLRFGFDEQIAQLSWKERVANISTCHAGIVCIF